MSLLKGLAARGRSLVAGAAEARMEEEFRFHLEMETERLVAGGMRPDEARRRALLAFGGLDQHREAMRDGRGARLLADFAGDVRYALRAMRRNPGFAIAVALTLGIGVGVNGIVFGFVNSLLFRPLPVVDANRLVGVFTSDTKSGVPGLLAYSDYVDLRDRSGAFAGLAGATGIPLNLAAPLPNGAGAAADMVWGEMVTENYFTVLGMRPALGRLFTAVDAPQGANAFAVLSYESWRQRFHGDSSVVGRVVRLNGAEFTITGVAAQGYKGLRTFGFWPELFVPVGMHDVVMPGSKGLLQGRGDGWLYVVGRMRQGWTRETTERSARLFATQLARAYPEPDEHLGITLVPGAGGFDHPGFVKPKVLLLASSLALFASIVTLLIICANLANMQLARAAARSRELAIRLSLGCSRGRLARQLLTESVILAVPGAIVAAVVVRLGPLLESSMLPHLQFQVGFGAAIDARVALFTGAVAALAVLLFGAAPALRASRARLAPASVIGPRLGVTRQPGRAGVLVVAQLAMSVVLLVGGTLFVRSLIAARNMNVGFDQSNRLLLSVNIGLQNYTPERGRRFYDDVLTRVRALPDVASAAWMFPVPFDTYGRGIGLFVDQARSNNKDGIVVTNASYVSEAFTGTLGLRVQAGRTLTAGDSAGAPLVMLVSRSLATRLWPGKDPIGQRARRGGASGPELLVVGVVDDATFSSIGDRSHDHVYIPVRQQYRDWETLVVHTRGDPAPVLAKVRDIVASLDPALPTFGATTMEQSVESGFATSRTAAMIAGFFAALALLIAAVGLYAVVAGSVVERTREIGVRLALGATPSGVLRFIMGGGARLGAWGLAIGLFCAGGVAKLMAGLLYGLSASDPVTFLIAPLTLAIVVVVATYLPARRAVKLDPMAALRSD